MKTFSRLLTAACLVFVGALSLIVACRGSGSGERVGAVGGGNAVMQLSQMTFYGTMAGDASIPARFIAVDGGQLPQIAVATCTSPNDGGTCTILQALPTTSPGGTIDVKLHLVAAQHDAGPAGGTGEWLCSVQDRPGICKTFRACTATEAFVTADSGADAAWTETVSVIATADASPSPCALKAIVGLGKGRVTDWNATTTTFTAQ